MQQDRLGGHFFVENQQKRKIRMVLNQSNKINIYDGNKCPVMKEFSSIDDIIITHSDMVYNCCYRVLNDHHSAEDVTQAVFILFSKKFKKLSDHPNIAGWLYRTAVFMSKGLQKKNNRRQKRESNTDLEAQDEKKQWALLAPVIDEIILNLPRKYSQAIRLKYIEGKSHEEIAELMKSPRGTVSSWISRGLEKVRLILSKKRLQCFPAHYFRGIGKSKSCQC